MDKERMSLRDFVRDPIVFGCNKHGIATDCIEYADQIIDGMTNAELVLAISDALEEYFEQFKGG